MTVVVDDIDEVMREIERDIDDAIVRGVLDGVAAFALHAPFWTGYYQANLVAFAGTGEAGVRIDPSERDPKQIGQFAEEAEQAVEEIVDFTTRPIPPVFTIDNPTHYAERIESGEIGTVTGDPPVMQRVAEAIAAGIDRNEE